MLGRTSPQQLLFALQLSCVFGLYNLDAHQLIIKFVIAIRENADNSYMCIYYFYLSALILYSEMEKKATLFAFF